MTHLTLKKIELKFDPDELRTLSAALEVIVKELHGRSRTLMDRIVVVELLAVYKKLAEKAVLPGEETQVTIDEAKAIALYRVLSYYMDKWPLEYYAYNVFHRLIMDIHPRLNHSTVKSTNQ